MIGTHSINTGPLHPRVRPATPCQPGTNSAHRSPASTEFLRTPHRASPRSDPPFSHSFSRLHPRQTQGSQAAPVPLAAPALRANTLCHLPLRTYGDHPFGRPNSLHESAPHPSPTQPPSRIANPRQQVSGMHPSSLPSSLCPTEARPNAQQGLNLRARKQIPSPPRPASRSPDRLAPDHRRAHPAASCPANRSGPPAAPCPLSPLPP